MIKKKYLMQNRNTPDGETLPPQMGEGSEEKTKNPTTYFSEHIEFSLQIRTSSLFQVLHFFLCWNQN